MTLSSVDSPGKKLHDRRLQKQMSVADAARLTHIRPDRIIDLEKDDYSNFPSLAYARGFLLIYGRLLGVDVAQAASRLENSNPVDIDEYEYLSGKSAPLTRSLGTGRRVFTVLFALASVLAVVVYMVIRFFETSYRLNDAGNTANDAKSAHPAPIVAATPTPAPVVTPEPVQPAPVVEATPAAPAINEVVLRPLKKAWVKIQKDTAGSDPVYDDWLYPDANGLTLHGKKFWIQLSDGDAVEIKKNGKTVPYTSPAIVVE